MMNVVEIVSEKIKEYIQKFLNYAALLADEQIIEFASWNFSSICLFHRLYLMCLRPTGMKVFMPTAQKNDRRGAKSSTPSPAATPVRRYSTPSAKV